MRVAKVLETVLGITGIVVESAEVGSEGVVFDVRPRRKKPRCSGCGKRAPGYDQRDARQWRHLSLGSTRIWLRYAPRRVECPECGVVNERVPWGAAGGWFGHEAQAKAKLRAESAAAPAGSAGASGPCNAWEKKICSSTGEQSAACAEAKAALDLLTPATCEVALAGVPATLAKVKASRASCDTLISRLCKELPPGSAACNLVKERTPSFPAARCDEMLSHYDEVPAFARDKIIAEAKAAAGREG